MPHSAHSEYWEADERLLRSLDGAEHLVAWFGFFPSFHDATIKKMEFAEDGGKIEIAAFRMTDAVDEKGYFVLDRHALVTIELKDVTGVVLDCHPTPTVLELGIRRIEAERLPLGNTAATDGDFEIGFDDVMGGGGAIYARSLRIHLRPDKPKGPDVQ